MAQRSPVSIAGTLPADYDDFDNMLQEMNCIEMLLNDNGDDVLMNLDAALTSSCTLCPETTNELFAGSANHQTHQQLQHKNTFSVFDLDEPVELLDKISGSPSERIGATPTPSSSSYHNEHSAPRLTADATTHSINATTPATSTTTTDAQNHTKRKRTPGHCEICNRSFNDLYNLRVHMMIHTGEMPFECEQCGKRFRQVSKLKIHRITHTNSKPFICDICGKGFRFRNYLSIHRRLHAGDKPYKCKFCDEHFQSLHMRRLHMKILHAETKTYACPLCPEVLTAQCYLTAHLKRHNNQRDFKCDRCAKCFYSVAQLRDHQLSHTDTKPFACELCDARFQRKSNYKQHLKIHSDDKTYVCHICNKAFTQNAGLYGHMKLHKQRRKSGKGNDS